MTLTTNDDDDAAAAADDDDDLDLGFVIFGLGILHFF